MKKNQQAPSPASFGQMFTSAQNLLRNQSAVSSPGSSQQLTSKQIDQIGKELEGRAAQGDLDGVQDILASRSDMIPKKSLNVSLRAAVKGCTTAILYYSIQCVGVLIDAGANINSEEANEGKTALMMACEKGYLELVSNLLEHDALIDHKDQRKRTPLMYAIGTVAQNLDVVNELLDRGADVNDSTLTGLTPLLLATRKEHSSIVKLLLTRGASINAQFPEDQNSSLHYACVQGNEKILQIILQHCTKELNDAQLQETLYLQNRDHKTALDLAKDLVDQEPDNEIRQQIFSLLRNLYSAKEKEIEDVVQKLLRKEEKQQVISQPQPALNAQIANEQQQTQGKKQKKHNVAGVGGVQVLGQVHSVTSDGRVVHQQHRQKNDYPTQQTPLEEPERQPQDETEYKIKAEFEEAKLSPKQPQRQALGSLSQTKKKKKGTSNNNSAKNGRKEGSVATSMTQEERKESMSPATVTDDDEFKSAESQTPPKEKYENKANEAQSNLNRAVDYTPKERSVSSDDDESFVEARSGNTGQNTAATILTTTDANPSAITPSSSNTQKNASKKGPKQETQNMNKASSKKQISNSTNQKAPQQPANNISIPLKDTKDQQIQLDTQTDKDSKGRQPAKDKQQITEHSTDAKSSSGQKSNSSQGASLGAVQQPIINQQSWPQIFIQQQQAKTPSSPNSTSNKQQPKQNAAVIENIMQQQQQQSPHMSNTGSLSLNDQQINAKEHSSTQQQSPSQKYLQPQQQQQQQLQLQQEVLSNNGADKVLGVSEPHGQPANAFTQQHHLVIPVTPTSTSMYPQAHQGSNAATQQHQKQPIQLCKNLDSKRAQMDFVVEMYHQNNRMLSYQVYTHKERIKEIEIESHQQRDEHALRVNEYYQQAVRYYENFRQLEDQMNNVSEKNETSLKQSLQLVEQLKKQVSKDHSVDSLITELESKLNEMHSINQKFTDEFDYRKEDEKSFLLDQDAQKKANETQVQKTQVAQKEMMENELKGASKQQMAQTQAQFNNLLIDMESVYGEDSITGSSEYMSRYPQQIYNKLHDEVIMFEESVRSIMSEIEPIKTIIIEKISSFIKQTIPNGEVEVYGSHATKLCLHWSDIDLVLKPVNRESTNNRGGASASTDQQMQYMGRRQTEHGTLNTNSTGFNMPINTRNWLNILYQELMKAENRGWLQKVDFIEATTVPVIKLACSFQHLSPNSASQLLLPNGNVPRYPQIVSTPINVDITLWSESHNGIPCVNLVKSYLKESQLIEPMILVLKQILKVWDFNDAYTGGLSSYALFLMIVSFLQEKRKPTLKTEVNIGETLLEFIRYYSQLDFSQYAICCKMPGEVSDKPNLYQNTNTDYSFFLQPRIVIDDPLMVNNNVGKSAFRFQEIKNIFSHAYNSAFTGCFCSCHFKSLLRNTGYNQNQSLQHQSQLALTGNIVSGLRQAPNFLQFQYPPHYTTQLNYANRPMVQESAAQSPFESDTTAQSTAASIAAPYSTATGTSQMMQPLLRTQSQPFQVQIKRSESNAVGMSSFIPNKTPAHNVWQPTTSANVSEEPIDISCSCDSVLARLIYGYTSYRRTMESLHPNFNTMSGTQSSSNHIQMDLNHFNKLNGVGSRFAMFI